jgi:DNA-directed RNA polymerase specialized sigma24 family protein
LRQVWRLHTLQDLRDGEIAHALGVPLSTVKTRLSRARHELRKRMENYTRSASASKTVRVTRKW